MQPPIKWYLAESEPVRAGDVTVVPRSRVLSIGLPFGGFVWQRPESVLVQRPSGEERLRILDVTRIAQVALFIVMVLALLRSR